MSATAQDFFRSARESGWLAVIATIIALFLIAPSIVVIVLSFSSGHLMTFPPPGFGLTWYQHFFATERWTASTWHSVQIGLVSMIFSTVLGTLAAFGLVRGRPRSARFIMALMLSPVIVPVIITAIGMFITFRQLGLGSFAGLVAAHTVLGIPYVFVTVTAALYDLDPDYELAALNLGALPVQSFWRITLPLILPGVLTGAIFAFVASWDEVVVALFLSTPQLRTLPVTMWEEARQTVDPTIAAASSMLTLLTFFIIVFLPLLSKSARRAREQVA